MDVAMTIYKVDFKDNAIDKVFAKVRGANRQILPQVYSMQYT